LKVIISEKPAYDGISPGRCKDCNRDLFWVHSGLNPEKKMALDDDPGPYCLERDEDGIHRAWHRNATDGYSYHYWNEGSCNGGQKAPPPSAGLPEPISGDNEEDGIPF
jgi:hypothetical protein